jgi:hypothetical protein
VILHGVTREPPPQDHSIDLPRTMDRLHDRARPGRGGAGFTQFRRVDVKQRFNAYDEARP